MAVVQIYYEESYFRSNTKEELIGFTEFLCMYLYAFFNQTAVINNLIAFILHSKYGWFTRSFYGF